MVRNRRLRKFHAIFNVGGAEPGLFPNRGAPFLLERAQNAAAHRIPNGAKKNIEIRTRESHDRKASEIRFILRGRLPLQDWAIAIGDQS